MTKASAPRNFRRKNSGKISHAHKQVAEVAKAAAHEHWDELARDNEFYSRWVSAYPELSAKALEDQFVMLNWGKYIPFARTTMANMLTTNIDPELKEQITEALVLDAQLIRGRADPATVQKVIK